MKKSKIFKFSKKYLLIFLPVIIVAVFISINYFLSNSEINIDHKIPYIPIDKHQLQEDGRFSDLEINKYITYDATSVNANLVGFSASQNEPSMEVSIPSDASISIIFKNKLLTREDLLGGIGNGVSYNTKVLGGNSWIVLNYSGPSYSYYLLGEEGYVELTIWTIDDGETALIKAEDFISTISLK